MGCCLVKNRVGDSTEPIKIEHKPIENNSEEIDDKAHSEPARLETEPQNDEEISNDFEFKHKQDEENDSEEIDDKAHSESARLETEPQNDEEISNDFDFKEKQDEENDSKISEDEPKEDVDDDSVCYDANFELEDDESVTNIFKYEKKEEDDQSVSNISKNESKDGNDESVYNDVDLEQKDKESITNISKDEPKENDNEIISNVAKDEPNEKIDESRIKNDINSEFKIEEEDSNIFKSKKKTLKQIQNEQTEEWLGLIARLNSNEKLLRYARSQDRTKFQTVNDVAQYLSKCSDARTQIEKAWLVYVWVTDNIAYDVVALKNKDYSKGDSQTVLTRGLGVCAGYANLFQSLCDALNVECEKISGFSKGGDYELGSSFENQIDTHAWNAIKCGSQNGSYRYIESTWGAGKTDQKSEKFEKEFEPYNFAVPAHIFMESHYSSSFNKDTEAPQMTVDEFGKTPMHFIEFHKLGLNYLNEEKNVETIIRSAQNPILIEYKSKQRLEFSSTLVDKQNDRKLEGVFDFTYVEAPLDTRSYFYFKYLLVAYLPEKWKNYVLTVFAGSEEKQANRLPAVAQYLVVREGDLVEENVPANHTRKFRTFGLSYQDQNQNRALLKTVNNTLLIKYVSNQRLELSANQYEAKSERKLMDNFSLAYVESDVNTANKAPYHYTVVAHLPERQINYILKVFAGHEDSKENYSIATYQVTREGDFVDENTPANHTNKFREFGLKYKDQNLNRTLIKSTKTSVFIEYLSNLKLVLISNLIEQSNNHELKDTTFTQRDFTLADVQAFKYCVMTFLPKKRTNYIWQIFGKYDDPNEKLSFQVAEYQVIREGDLIEVNMPQYNLTFNYGIALKSHHTQVISFDTNPLVLEFVVPETTKTLLQLVDNERKTIKNSILSQYNPLNNHFIVSVAVGKTNEPFYLILYANKSINSEKEFKFVTEFRINRNSSNKNDKISFTQFYSVATDFLYVYSPQEYELKSSKEYKFQYFIKDAKKVALIDADQNQYFLENTSNEPNIWVLNQTFSTKGKLTLFAKLGQESQLTGLCYYNLL